MTVVGILRMMSSRLSSPESSSEPAKDDKASGEGEEGGSGEASRNEDDVHAVKALPIVVLKNYNAGKRDDVLDVLGQWAAGLVDNQVRCQSIYTTRM